MKFRKKLNNPFLLAGQGFALGAILFFATQSKTSEAHVVDDAPSSLLTQVSAGR